MMRDSTVTSKPATAALEAFLYSESLDKLKMPPQNSSNGMEELFDAADVVGDVFTLQFPKIEWNLDDDFEPPQGNSKLIKNQMRLSSSLLGKRGRDEAGSCNRMVRSKAIKSDLSELANGLSEKSDCRSSSTSYISFKATNDESYDYLNSKSPSPTIDSSTVKNELFSRKFSMDSPIRRSNPLPPAA